MIREQLPIVLQFRKRFAYHSTDHHCHCFRNPSKSNPTILQLDFCKHLAVDLCPSARRDRHQTVQICSCFLFFFADGSFGDTGSSSSCTLLSRRGTSSCSSAACFPLHHMLYPSRWPCYMVGPLVQFQLYRR